MSSEEDNSEEISSIIPTVHTPEGPLGELIKSSRSFLHDISNQLLIAHGMESFVINNLKKRGDIDEKIISKMEKSLKAMDKIMDMMKDHKQYIVTASGSN